MRCSVGEEKIDDNSDDGEQEDQQTPQKFVRDWTVGLDNLNCTGNVVSKMFRFKSRHTRVAKVDVCMYKQTGSPYQ